MPKANKIYIEVSDANVSRLAKKYKKLDTEYKDIKLEKEQTLEVLRDATLAHFQPEDEECTRLLKTPTIRVQVNKRTVRNVVKTDMEQVFEEVCNQYNIPRSELDEIVERNTINTEVEVKPTVKVLD